MDALNPTATLGPEVVATFPAKTVALLIEAAELHAQTLHRLNARTGDGSLGEEAGRLDEVALLLRDINLARPMLTKKRP
jgi:hypothetical protein